MPLGVIVIARDGAGLSHRIVGEIVVHQLLPHAIARLVPIRRNAVAQLRRRALHTRAGAAAGMASMGIAISVVSDIFIIVHSSGKLMRPTDIIRAGRS
jgi:hypothetical protein